MSDIQQYGARGPLSDPPSLGEYVVVTYADHVAAIAAARAEGRRQEWVNQNDEIQANRDEGYAAGVQAARDAVRNTPTDPRWNILQIERAFLAAIDALLKEKP